jgi:hypothetical protein
MSFKIISAIVVGALVVLGAIAQPSKVDIRNNNGVYRIYLNGQPFYIKGAGCVGGAMDKLKSCGGNSIRTWSADNGREILDRAHKNGLYVAMGLDVDHERRGFDYNDAKMVARQFELLKSQVLELRNHPALLLWVVGNELNFEKNPKVWDAVNGLSKMIHEVDPNHPTTSTLAGFKPETVSLVKTRATDLDFISFQMYCDIVNLPRYLREAHWDKPYVVTEWGATGHWEVGNTKWGAPLENDSSTKADWYEKRFHIAIESDQKLCLGSYVFLWGNKQERTPTWYGMFLASGEQTEAIDAVQNVWTGQWPANRSPRVAGAWLDGKTAQQNVTLIAGRTYAAKVSATDPEHDALSYNWDVMEESKETKIGGDAESKPATIRGVIANPGGSEISLTAPTRPGAYRLFAYIRDGKGNAAHVNIPFRVEAANTAATQQNRTASLK